MSCPSRERALLDWVSDSGRPACRRGAHNPKLCGAPRSRFTQVMALEDGSREASGCDLLSVPLAGWHADCRLACRSERLAAYRTLFITSLANSSAGGTLRLRSLVLARLVAIAAPLPSTVVPITKRLGKAQSVPCQYGSHARWRSRSAIASTHKAVTAKYP